MDSKIYILLIMVMKFAVHSCENNDTAPLEPCDPSPCGEDSICHIVYNRSMCSCLPGFLGSPPSCRPECDKNADCPENKACFDHKCKDPCETHSCGQKAICQVFAHTPICSCILNRAGNPSVNCDRVLHCGLNAVRKQTNDSMLCECEQGFTGDPYSSCNRPCKTNDECLQDRTCFHNECVDSCSGVCGRNTKCIVIDHSPMCLCAAGYTGDPYEGCSPVFAPHNSQYILMYSDAKEVRFNCKEYLTSPNSSQVALINMSENKITTFTPYFNKKFSKADNGTILCCLVYVNKGTGNVKNITHSVENITLLVNDDKIDNNNSSYNTTIYAISASVGIIIITLAIIISFKKCCKNSISDKQEPPQIKNINPNDVFYLNLLFQRECQREIEEEEHHYEEIDYVEIGPQFNQTMSTNSYTYIDK